MTENTYYKPRLVIGDREITNGMSGSIIFSGNNQPNTFNCKISDPQFQNYKLHNEEIKMYLNYGADDGVPIFRGFIKEVMPNDTETNINLDVIAICVEYDEYETLQEVLKYYNLKTRQELEDRTVVIDIPNSKALIVGAF